MIGTRECEAAGIKWKAVDARDWYRAMRLGIFKHAFVSPFEMMEMLTQANAEEDPMFKIRVGMAGANNSLGRYGALNIIEKSAEAEIESQKQKYENLQLMN